MVEKTVRKTIEHKEKIIYAIFISIVAIIAIIRLKQGNPLIYHEESYFNLYSIQNGGINSSYQTFLYLITKIIPHSLLYFVTPLIGIATIFLLNIICKRLKVKKSISLFFMVVFFLTPATIITYTTLSSHSFMFLMLLLGFYFLTSKKKKYLAVPFFLLMSLIDGFSGVIAFITLFSYRMFIEKKKTDLSTISKVQKDDPTNLSLVTVFITTLVSLTVLSLPWMHFTPTSQAVLLDLFSDFGAISGLSSFVLILSIIGLTFSWRKQRVVYWLLAITVASYLSNTHALFVLVIILSYFSAVALSRFSETEWKLKDLQTLTVFLLLLGLLFSNITFVDRVQGFSPTNEMKESLEWIKLDADNFEKGRWSVLSISQDEYFVNYYTQLKIFDHSLVHLRTDEIQQIDLSKLHEGQEIFSIPYPHILFPLLKEQNVRYVYLDASLKDILQEDEGVRFALRNERFKLLYSSGETEVWKFR